MRRRLVTQCFRREAGAVAVVVALFMVVLTSAAALGIDLGRIAWAHRSLQGLSDEAALDAVRAVGDRRVPGSEESQAFTLAARSLTRNDYDYTDTAAGHSLGVVLGIADPNTRVFVPLPSGGPMDLANALKVGITTTTGHIFVGGETDLEAAATAMIDDTGSAVLTSPSPAPSSTPPASSSPTPSPPSTLTANPGIAGISVGSFAARVDSDSSPVVTTLNATLPGLLGVNTTIDAAGYNGLVDASITLQALQQQLGALLGLGSADQVLNATVTFGELITATTQALNADGSDASVAAAGALDELKTVDTSYSVPVADLLKVSVSDATSAANAQLNVLTLVAMAAEIANTNRLVSLNVPVTITGVTSATLAMGFVEKPSQAIGEARTDATGAWITRAHTAQTRMLLTMTLADSIPIAGVSYPVTVPVYLEAGGADAWLTGADCNTGAVAVHAATQPLHAWIGTVPSDAMTNKDVPVTVTPATLVEAPGVTVTGSGSAGLDGGSADLAFGWGSPPGTTPPVHQTVGASAVKVGDLLESQLTVTTAPEVVAPPVPSDIATLVAEKVAPVLAQVDEQLHNLTSLLEIVPASGLTLAGADVGNFFLGCAPSTTTTGGGSGGGGSGGGDSGGGGSGGGSPAPSPTTDRRRLIG